MHRRSLLWSFVLVVVISGLIVGVADRTVGLSSFFWTRCSDCHSDDNSTCAGCHMHRGNLSAWTDQTEYAANAPVVITLDSSGEGSGWVRGILYDHTGAYVMEVGGPTGTGDDGSGNPNTFPIDFAFNAPSEAGDYTYEATWFGSNNSGTGHLEDREPVLVRVVVDQSSTDDWGPMIAAGQLRLSAYPNPMHDTSTLRFGIGPDTGGAHLRIVDAGGRMVRDLGFLSASSQVQQLRWDGRAEGGDRVTAGAYFAVLSIQTMEVTERILVLK